MVLILTKHTSHDGDLIFDSPAHPVSIFSEPHERDTYGPIESEAT
jgi:hypothetical protein